MVRISQPTINNVLPREIETSQSDALQSQNPDQSKLGRIKDSFEIQSKVLGLLICITDRNEAGPVEWMTKFFIL